MATIDQFRTDVLIEVPSAPIPLVDREITRTIIEVCEKAYVWKEELHPQIATTNNQTMHLSTPKDSRIAGVIELNHGGHRILSATERELDDTRSEWRSPNGQSETISYFYLKDRTTVVFSDVPSCRMRIKVIAILKPSLDARRFPDFIREDYADLIAMGAKYRLLKMNGQAWSNPNLATFEQQNFNKELKRAKAERINDFTRSSTLTIRPVSYW